MAVCRDETLEPLPPWVDLLVSSTVVFCLWIHICVCVCVCVCLWFNVPFSKNPMSWCIRLALDTCYLHIVARYTRHLFVLESSACRQCLQLFCPLWIGVVFPRLLSLFFLFTAVSLVSSVIYVSRSIVAQQHYVETGVENNVFLWSSHFLVVVSTSIWIHLCSCMTMFLPVSLLKSCSWRFHVSSIVNDTSSSKWDG